MEAKRALCIERGLSAGHASPWSRPSSRANPSRRPQSLPGLTPFSGSEAQARQRLHAWMRNLTSGLDPRS